MMPHQPITTISMQLDTAWAQTESTKIWIKKTHNDFVWKMFCSQQATSLHQHCLHNLKSSNYPERVCYREFPNISSFIFPSTSLIHCSHWWSERSCRCQIVSTSELFSLPSWIKCETASAGQPHKHRQIQITASQHENMTQIYTDDKIWRAWHWLQWKIIGMSQHVSGVMVNDVCTRKVTAEDRGIM